MATDTSTPDELRQRLHRITPWDEGPSIGDKVVTEGLRQLSLPGQYARGLLSGRPGEKATGEEMLKSWGIQHPHPIGSFAWDVATDPLTYAGPGVVKAGGKAADLLRAGGRVLGEGASANPLVNALTKLARQESGALGLKFDPYVNAEAAGKQRFDPDWVNQRTFYHGTATPLESAALDPLKTSQSGLFGRGIYTTDEGGLAHPTVTSGYAKARYGTGTTAVTDVQQALSGMPTRSLGKLAREMKPIIDAEVAKLGGLENVPRARAESVLDPREKIEDWYRRYEENTGLLGRMRGNPQGVVHAFPRTLAALYPEGTGSMQRVAAQIRGLGVPLGEIAAPRIYQAQSNFGKILDLERPLYQYPKDFSADLLDLARTHAGHEPIDARRMQQIQQSMKELNTSVSDVFAPIQRTLRLGTTPETVGDPFLELLKSHGFDAMTHTGGGRWLPGADPHQVVIGLDPNDVLGMGRATPYPQWQPYASLR